MTYSPTHSHRCPWCGPAALCDSDPDPALLCTRHYAEWSGLSISEVERMERDELADAEGW